ncbi:hypothetical protein [Novosphingobium sp.]|uniref:hypothetical protein n=1 Tax=Novosphingobium sp. TaxID=1874826 RepID=UPI0035AE797C
MNQDELARVIILTTMLALVVRALTRRKLELGRSVWMAAVWGAIIAILVVIFTQFPPRGG